MSQSPSSRPQASAVLLSILPSIGLSAHLQLVTSLPGIDPVVDASGRGKVLRSLFRLYFGADRLRWCEQLNGATECVVLEEPTVVYPYIIEPTPISMALRELLECDRGDDLRPHDGDRFPYKGYVGWLFS